MKKIILPTLCFLLGFSIHFFIPRREVTNISFQKELNQVTEKYEMCQQEKISLSNAFENLTNNELKDYIELKKLKEKYLKADEILGKVMLLFLANVKVQANSEVKNYFMTPKSQREDVDVEESNVSKNIGTKVIVNPYGVIDKASGEIEDLENSTIENQIKITKRAVIEYQKSKPVESMQALGVFYGKFEGELKRLKGPDKGLIDWIELEINFHEDSNRKLTGMYFIQLSRNNVPYSTNRGGGDNKQIRTVDGKSNFYFLEVSPNSFIEIKRPKNSDKMEGNFYQNDIYVGGVRLYRKD